MKKPSRADKKAQKLLNDPQYLKNWAAHMKSYGPILSDAFSEDPQARVALCSALTHITGKNQAAALLKLNSLQKSLSTDADKAAFFFAMGLFCEYAGKFEEMAAFYSQANDLNHRFFLPYMKVGKYALDACDYDKAENAYRAAISCFPGFGLTDRNRQLLASAHTNLASCLIMTHRFDQADAALETSRKYLPQFPGRFGPEAILHALRKETQALLSSLNDLKTFAPFAYDSIKKSTDRILAGTEPQFFLHPIAAENVTSFWNWFSGEETGLKTRLDKEEYDSVITALGDALLRTFPFLEGKPYVAIGKGKDGYVIQLKDLHAVAIVEAFQVLLAACPETVSSRWHFHVIH